jgi:sugar lactone lactonase YvrE
MKLISTVTFGALVIFMCASIKLHAQNQLTISGNRSIGSKLTVNLNRPDIEKVEWKYNGKVIETSGSSRKGVTVAGGHCTGSNPNQLTNPNGVFVDKDDNVWVADTRNFRIQKFTPGNRNGTTIGAELPNAPSFPVNLFVKPNGDLYVADFFEAKVKLLKKGGTEWINVAGQNNELDLVRGLWIDNNDNVFCTQYGFFFNGNFDILDGMVLKYPKNSSAFEIVAGHNGIGSALNQFSQPGSVMLDEDGAMYITDGTNDHGQQNARVLKWAQGAPEGVVVAGGNGEGDQANQCPSPAHAFVDKKGNVYVSNYTTFKVTKWKPGGKTGEIVAGGNGFGDAANQLSYPQGIFVKGKYLFVVDSYNERVQRFDLSEPNHYTHFKPRHPGKYTAAVTLADGSVLESNVITIESNKQTPVPGTINKNRAIAYPNPSNNTVTVDFTSEKNGRYIVELSDLTGRVLSSREINAGQGANRTLVSISQFAKGTYFIKLIKPNGTKESMQIIKE